MIRRNAILRPTFYAPWNLVQTECIVTTMRRIRESVHQKSITKRWFIGNANMEIIVFLVRGGNKIISKLVDFMISTEGKLSYVSRLH